MAAYTCALSSWDLRRMRTDRRQPSMLALQHPLGFLPSRLSRICTLEVHLMHRISRTPPLVGSTQGHLIRAQLTK